ncbi:hypothetical protein [Thiorhodovibrio winogradskyi]|uniref:hypothetical protein n=1 Tax=Thiorhodovibrio winogradskyi TaxID=77007 RepID=UPI002E286B34|nr:hypothetical protein [Thiorhodovibrio winogradskyi]
MPRSTHSKSQRELTKQRQKANRFAAMQTADLTPDEQDTLVALALKTPCSRWR